MYVVHGFNVSLLQTWHLVFLQEEYLGFREQNNWYLQNIQADRNWIVTIGYFVYDLNIEKLCVNKLTIMKMKNQFKVGFSTRTTFKFFALSYILWQMSA